MHAALLNKSDFAVTALADCEVGEIGRHAILSILANHSAIARALWWSSLVDAAILQEWLTGLGQRSADIRIAHLFCELHARMKSVGLAMEREFALPISQVELADTVGISTVHVNRSLKRLRLEKLVSFEHHNVVIHDVGRLAEYADFDPGYLHLSESNTAAL